MRWLNSKRANYKDSTKTKIQHKTKQIHKNKNTTQKLQTQEQRN
jgi:hypothetical protein